MQKQCPVKCLAHQPLLQGIINIHQFVLYFEQNRSICIHIRIFFCCNLHKHFNLYSLKHLDYAFTKDIRSAFSSFECYPVCHSEFTQQTKQPTMLARPLKIVYISCLCWRAVGLEMRGFYLNSVFTFVYSTSIVFVWLSPQRLLLSILLFIYCFRLFQSVLIVHSYVWRWWKRVIMIERNISKTNQ